VNGRGIDFAYDDDGLLTQAGSLGLTRDPWESAALRVQGQVYCRSIERPYAASLTA
jgi:hypothetical protein